MDRNSAPLPDAKGGPFTRKGGRLANVDQPASPVGYGEAAFARIALGWLA